MAGRIDEVQLVTLSVLRLVEQRDALRLDGDAALALQRHVVEHLRLHLAIRESAAHLDQAVGKRGLAVIHVGDDREIADLLHEAGTWETAGDYTGPPGLPWP